MNNDEYILDLFHKSNSVYGSLRPLQNLFFYTISGESNFLSNIKSLNSNIAKPRVTDEISSLTTSAINSIVIDVSGSNPYSAIVNINYNDPGITATNRLGVSLTVDVSSNVNSTVLGEYIVEYIITSADNLFRTRYFRTVYIVDTVSPIITILGSNPLIIEVYGDLTGIEFGATATDNFDSIVNVTQVSNLDISNTGTYEIVYSVSDSNGNDMSAVRIINVVDTTSPFITISGDNPSTFEVYTVYVDAGATATDNYDQSVSVVTTGSVDISTVGQYTLTYNATDACGNQATPKTRIVNVVDTTSPFITISGDNPATFEVYTVYVDAGATATDNYDQSVSVVTTGSVDISTVGQYTLTYNATDACGNQATPKTRIVNIVDIISPTHSLLGDNPLVWTMTQTYVDPGYDASDNYDVSLTVVVETNLNINVVGSYYYKYIFTDDYSNSANVTRTVYVIDYSVIHNIPVINIAEDSSMNILNILNQMTNSNYLKNTNLLADRFAIDFANKDESYILPFDTYKTLYSGDNNIVIFAHGFSNETIELVDAQSNAVGNYKYPYITSEINIKSMVNIVFDNSLNCKVVVLDGKHSDLTDYFVPNITLTGNNPTTIEVNSTFNVSQLEQAASAVDYQNNNITSTMQVYNNLDITTVGVYEMLYVATDPSGYQVTKLRTLKVVDTTLPVITMVTVSGDVNILWDVYNTFVDPGFSVSDNYDLSLSAADVVVTGTVDISSLGLNTLTYNVSDVYGNAAITKTRIVSVVDREPPVIVIDGSASLNHILNTSYIDAGVTITDNYFSLEQLTIDTSNNVDINVVGTYKVIYNATDPCGNAALPKERTVNVYDNILPVITLVSVSGEINVTLEVYSQYIEPGYDASDNYDLSLSAADVVVTGTVDISSLGLNTLTYNVSDVYGNAAITKTRIVSVVDREPPVIVIDGSASLNHILNTSYIDAGVTITDNYFSLEQLTIDTSNNVDINVVGTYKVIYNATDPCGNAALPKERTVSVYNPTALSGLIPTVVDYQIPKYYTLAPSNQIYSMGSEYYKAYCVPTSFASVLNYYNEIQGLNIQLNYTSLNSMAPETDYMFNFNNRLAGVTGVTDPAKIDLGYYFNTNAQGFDLSSGSYVGTRLKDFNKFVDFMTVISPSAQYHYYYKGLNNSIAYTNISGATETPYSANDITTNVILSDISANISTAKPVILSFLHWNIIDSGATVNVDGTHINLYNFSGYSPTPDVGLPIYAANPELIEEVWTNENSETNLGHTVVCVGYIENYNGKNWIIVQDNVSQPSDPNLTHRYVGIELDYTVLIMCTFMDFTPQAGNPVNNIVVSSNISPLPEGFNSSLRIYDTSLLDISQQFIINDNQNLDDISNNVAVYMVNDGLYIECASGNVYDGLNLVSVMVDVCLNDIKQSATTDFSFTIVNDLSGKYQLVNAVEPELEYLFITSSSTDYSVDANFMDISSGPLLLGTFSF